MIFFSLTLTCDQAIFFMGGGGGIHSITYSIFFPPRAKKNKTKNRLIAGYPYVFLDFLASVYASLLRFSTFHLVAQMRFSMLSQITNWGDKHELY